MPGTSAQMPVVVVNGVLQNHDLRHPSPGPFGSNMGFYVIGMDFALKSKQSSTLC